MKLFLTVHLFFLSFFYLTNVQAFTTSCASECEGWDNSNDLAVEFNPSSCPSELTAEIEEAFAIWNNVSTSKLKLKIGAANNEAVATIVGRVRTTPEIHAPVIACDPNFQTTLSLSSAEADGILGVSQILTIGGSRINTGYVLLNTQTGAGGNISDKTPIQRKIVLAHEIGHLLGIGHSAENSALMFFSIGEKAALRLNQDDINAMSYFYPRNEPSDPFLGCGLVDSGNNIPPSKGFFFLLFLPILAFTILRKQRVLNPISSLP